MYIVHRLQIKRGYFFLNLDAYPANQNRRLKLDGRCKAMEELYKKKILRYFEPLVMVVRESDLRDVLKTHTHTQYSFWDQWSMLGDRFTCDEGVAKEWLTIRN